MQQLHVDVDVLQQIADRARRFQGLLVADAVHGADGEALRALGWVWHGPAARSTIRGGAPSLPTALVASRRAFPVGPDRRIVSWL